MSEKQTFENHSQAPMSWVKIQLVFIAAIIVAIIGLALSGTRAGAVLALVAVLLAGLAGMATLVVVRGYCTKLQDRIIRTEMRLRLRDILPADMHELSNQLTLRQLIGLRFASDQELPALVRRALDEGLEEGAIKQLVTDWQGDHIRV